VVTICTTSLTLNNSTFCPHSAQCIYVFCVDLRTNSDYFSIYCWFQDAHSGHWIFNMVRGLNGSRSQQTYAVATSRHWISHSNMKQKWTQTRTHYVDSNIGEVAYGGFNTGFIDCVTLNILLCQNCLEWSVISLKPVTLATSIKVLVIGDMVSGTVQTFSRTALTCFV
jgi:hypothetical protein